MSKDVFHFHTRDSGPLPTASSHATTDETSVRPHGKISLLLRKAKKHVTKRISRSKIFRGRDPAQNVDHEGASSTPNIEDAASSVESMDRARAALAAGETPCQTSRAGSGSSIYRDRLQHAASTIYEPGLQPLRQDTWHSPGGPAPDHHCTSVVTQVKDPPSGVEEDQHSVVTRVQDHPSGMEEQQSVVAHVQDPSSGTEEGQQPVVAALQIANDAAAHMNTLGGHARTVASAAKNAPADLDTADNVEATYLQPLTIFNSVIGKIADVHPYAKMALGVLSYASTMVLAQADRDAAILQLLKTMGQVYNFIAQDDTLGQISATQHSILGQISQQILECARFIRDYSETVNFWKRLGKNIISETDATIQRYHNVLDQLMQNFRDQVIREVAVFVHRTGDMLELSGMPYAAHAGLDTRKQCLAGTRTEILSQITEWIYGNSSERVLWLSGPAGKGKSAIAHTIAKWSKDMGAPSSCYCFDRHRDADLRHEKVFSTIARDLADHDLGMRRALTIAVQDDIALKNTADIIQQWDKLLMKPLGKFSGSAVGPVVIVIDALDESGGVETRSDLLRILSGKLQSPDVPQITELPHNFRFIVTSRPLCDINDELASAQHIKQISMDEIPPEVAERDIYAYVSNRLTGLSNFGEREFAALAEKADGLFEWARLACEHIRRTPPGIEPTPRFNAVVNRDPGKRKNLLYDMYRLILEDIMGRNRYENDEYEEGLARFRSVMGQILGATGPLPVGFLNTMRACFPDESEHYQVEVVIKHMGSLLSGTTDSSTPIRPLHTSFCDFLADQSHSMELFVDVSKVHRDLALGSLRVMEDELRFNICDLESSYLPNCRDTGLQERVKRRITPRLSSACQFWAAHVRTTDFDTELAKEVKNFLNHERLLFWLEALSLIDALLSAVPALSLITQWLKDHPGFEDVSSTAMDMQRFIQIFGDIILHSTPHLYVSALSFSPVISAMSRKFAANFPNTIRLTAGRESNWPAFQSVLRGHMERVLSVSFSPDGTRIVTGSDDMTVWLWDVASGQPVGQPLKGHNSSVTSVSFSPDGTRIATGSEDETVRLWNAATGQPIGKPLRGHTEPVSSVSFSPDGTRIATGSWDKTVRLWDTATGKPVGQPLEGHSSSVNSVSFSPNGIYIVTGSWDKTVRLWDVATGQPVGQPLQGHTGSVTSVSFSPDGTRIATGSRDKTVRLWDATTRQAVGQPFLGHTHSVNSVSFSPDGTRIATGSSDKTVRLWDAVKGQPVGQPLQGHNSSVTSVSFSPDGTRIATGAEDETVRLWNAATGKPVGPTGQPLQGHTYSVNSASFSPDGTCIVTGLQDYTVRLWDAATGQPIGQLKLSEHALVYSVSFSPDGTRIVTGSWGGAVQLWDAATGEPILQPFVGHTGLITSVSFSPDGVLIATGSSDKTIRLWDVATGQPVGQPLQGHTESVTSVSFSPDGTCIVTGSKDKTIWLWDAVTGQPVGQPFRGHTHSVNSVAFSPNGIYIVTASEDKTVRLWDVATRRPVGQLQGHTHSVNSVAFSPDGTCIISGSSDKTVRLWDAVTGRPVGEPLRGHIDVVGSVSFSPDGTRIMSCSDDGTTRLWYAVNTQQFPGPLPQCTANVCSAFSPDSSYTTHPTEEITTMSRNIRNSHSICFSPSLTHALHNTTELIQVDDTSPDGHRLTSFLLEVDGWMVGPNHRLLFWVPPASRQAFHYNPRTALVIPRGCVELDLSRMAHGRHWQHCRDNRI